VVLTPGGDSARLSFLHQTILTGFRVETRLAASPAAKVCEFWQRVRTSSEEEKQLMVANLAAIALC